MFTGLISDEGILTQISGAGERVLTIAPVERRFTYALGDSIAVNGICLTVAAMTASDFNVTASPETLRVTTAGNWQSGDRVNLEPSLKLGDALGGHLVSGHVDGVGKVMRITKMGESSQWEFSYPGALAPYLAAKGSITIDGVSLTVNQVTPATFSVMIIPHTAKVTGFARLNVGDKVNLEIDMLARYVARQLELRA
jgi:riboflavin synthase